MYSKKNERSFKEKVLLVVSRIPRGKTISYSDVAIKAGHPKAFRAVGTFLKSNYNLKIPCHRVIRADGSCGEYNRGKAFKIRILREEGIVLTKVH